MVVILLQSLTLQFYVNMCMDIIIFQSSLK